MAHVILFAFLLLAPGLALAELQICHNPPWCDGPATPVPEIPAGLAPVVVMGITALILVIRLRRGRR